MKIKWSNIPIPVAHLVGLALGYILHRFIGILYITVSPLISALGWFFLIAGIAFTVWAVIASGDADISKSERLLTAGPYAFSRNPMYLGWFDIYSGLALLLRSPWMLIMLPLVLVYIHFVDIKREERLLSEKFGREYNQYQEKVRRYL